ncbi:ester cyclase [Aromatoleum toluolicum]|uniref:Predicted ester cyclase n=2 Tax=Aromatoleum TaxID=551759 RepID=A0A1N6Y260_9RHOO|nr:MULTISPECIES: ester cyclase [Aromatoleum]NMF99122.1 ester cyclase [Aromatoleum toluolicum]SIR08549.1 Predicted ester cyclase [Aromatoleum tolulyticum]
MSNANRELVKLWFEQVWNKGDESVIDRLMSPTATVHGLGAADDKPVSGPEGFKTFFRAFRTAFPDIRIRILRTICDGDMVACHCAVTATHTGGGLGVAPSKAPIEIYGVSIARIENGQIQEGWNCYDFLSLYQQIGLLPKLAEKPGEAPPLA